MKFILSNRIRIALLVLALNPTSLGCSPPKRTASVTEVIVERDTGASASADELAPLLAAPLEEPAPAPAEPTFASDTNGPAREVLETAEQMLDDSVVVRGSCYGYIAAVFDRAGYGARRARQVVFQGPRNGPYADLELVRPGDWLFIVAYPDMRPVGTHSVLFVRWEDREAGQARVVSYVGGQAKRPADMLTRDVSLTYAIQRARVTGHDTSG